MANETGAERFYDKNYDQFLVLGSEVVPTVVGQEGARNRVFRFAEAYKDSCTRELEARIAELSKRLGKPRCLDCNAAGMTNCSHFDNCAGTWKYALEDRAEKAEAEVRELKATLLSFDDCPSSPTFCNCAAHLALKKLRGEGPSD